MSLKNVLFKIGCQIKAHRSEIAITGGALALVGAVGFGIKSGMEIVPILDERKAKVERYEAALNKEDEDEVAKKCEEYFDEEYDEEDYDHDVALANKECFLGISKKLLVPLSLMGLAGTLFVYGYVEEKKHSAILAGALASTQTAFTAYRERVKTYVGEEKEEFIYRGGKKVVEKDEDGNEVEKEIIETNDGRQLGLKSIDRCFDESNENWVDGSDWNRDFLFRVQEEMNRLLQDRCENGIGVVFLNEVYEALGYDKTADGNILGWYYEYGNDSAHNHKGVIDFGLGCPDTAARLFMNGYEKNVWLRFNVDGDMIDLIRKRGISFK